jgi:hypothetical protein
MEPGWTTYAGLHYRLLSLYLIYDSLYLNTVHILPLGVPRTLCNSKTTDKVCVKRLATTNRRVDATKPGRHMKKVRINSQEI